MHPFVELVTFRVRPGISPDQVTDAAEEVNRFLLEQPGFLSRHLGATEDGTWYDILYWESGDHVAAAMEKVAASPHCALFFGLIDPAHDSMALYPAQLSLAVDR